MTTAPVRPWIALLVLASCLAGVRAQEFILDESGEFPPASTPERGTDEWVMAEAARLIAEDEPGVLEDQGRKIAEDEPGVL